MITVECDYCGSDVEKEYPSQVNEDGNNFCSRSCSGKHRGSSSGESVTYDCDWCGLTFERPQSRLRGEKNFCDEDCYSTWQSKYMNGERHPNWQGGCERNPEVESAWRTAVFQRDDYTCQDCGERGGRLNAHHIERRSNRPDLKYMVWNGATLCLDCHAERHKGERVYSLLKSKVTS